jgi:hypothetical protein
MLHQGRDATITISIPLWDMVCFAVIFGPSRPLAEEAGIPSSAHADCVVHVDMGKTARIGPARVLVLRRR